MEIRTILVVGAGQMGSGIAQVAAQSGYNVILHDVEERFVERGLGTIRRHLDRAVEKGKLTAAARDEALARIRTTTALEEARGADFVIEAVTENLAIKADVFRRLDEAAPPHAILASNTSSLPITELAANTKRPEKVIGMHFMNPCR